MRPLCCLLSIPFSICSILFLFTRDMANTVHTNANMLLKPEIILDVGWKCSSQKVRSNLLCLFAARTQRTAAAAAAAKCTFPLHSNSSPVVKNNPRPFFPHMTSRFVIFFATGLLRWNGRMTRRTNAKWPSSEFVAKAQSKAAAVGQG